MVTAPRQNWELVEARSRDEDQAWLRSLSVQDRFSLYEDLVALITSATRDSTETQRMDRWYWDQKVATRQKMLSAYAKLDQLRRERAAANHSG